VTVGVGRGRESPGGGSGVKPSNQKFFEKFLLQIPERGQSREIALMNSPGDQTRLDEQREREIALMNNEGREIELALKNEGERRERER